MTLHRGLQIHDAATRHRPILSDDEVDASMFQPFPHRHLPKLRRAIDLLVELSADNRACDEVFRNSGFGKTLAQLLAGLDIWVSYNPLTDATIEGGTAPAGYAQDKEILVFEQAMGYEPLMLASVLTHELDHVNGVRANFQPLDRWAHGMANHAAQQCTGVLSPRTTNLNKLEWYPHFRCGSCRKFPD